MFDLMMKKISENCWAVSGPIVEGHGLSVCLFKRNRNYEIKKSNRRIDFVTENGINTDLELEKDILEYLGFEGKVLTWVQLGVLGHEDKVYRSRYKKIMEIKEQKEKK